MNYKLYSINIADRYGRPLDSYFLEQFKEIIKTKFDTWSHYMNGYFLVVSNLQISSVNAFVQPLLEKYHFKCLVFEVGTSYYGYMPNNTWEWLSSAVKSIDALNSPEHCLFPFVKANEMTFEGNTLHEVYMSVCRWYFECPYMHPDTPSIRNRDLQLCMDYAKEQYIKRQKESYEKLM